MNSLPRPASRIRDRAADRVARLSLRARLLAMVIALLLVTFAVVGLVSTLALRHFLVGRLDQQLADAGQRFAVSLEHPADRDADAQFASVVGQPVGTLGARVAAGRVTAAGLVGGSVPVSDGDRAVLARIVSPAKPRTIQLPVLGEYRIVVVAGRDGDLLVTGLPEHPVDETTTHLAVTEAVAFGVAIVLAAGVGAASIRLSLRPLREVTHTARRAADLPLASGEVLMPEPVPNPAPETEVGQVAEAFNHLLEHVESALNQRHASEDRLRQFIADASHELRTPLAVIASHAEFALRTRDELPDDVRQALGRIDAESDRMAQLVEDLLTLARLDAGRSLDLNDVDLTRLALDAAGDRRRTTPDHRWQLDLPEEPVVIRGDANAIHQVISNLLSNAATHTPAGTTVTVSVRQSRAKNRAEISVQDDGPGIPDELIAHAFQRFVRGDPARTHTSGNTGLGLAIVDGIVRAHGGTVEIASVRGRTTFTIRLPHAFE